MSGTNATVSRVTGTSTLVRPRFEPGMLLQHDDLEQMNSYTRELNRLMFRSLFGCGVVCGLVVTTEGNCGKDYIIVGAGLALDGCGDPIHVPKDQRLVIDEDCDPGLKPPLWVLLCRSSKNCAPRTALCASDDDETSSVCTRERDGYEIRIVRQLPKCICHCELPSAGSIRKPGESIRTQFNSECWCVDPEDPCYRAHYDGKCECSCDDCADGPCDCDCVLLAKLDRTSDRVTEPMSAWTADHHPRRFVRPVLMRDHQVYTEEHPQLTGNERVAAENEKVTVLRKKRPKVKTPKAPSV